MPRLKAMGTPIKSNTMKYPKRSMMALSCSKKKDRAEQENRKRTANKESVAGCGKLGHKVFQCSEHHQSNPTGKIRYGMK